MKDVEVEVKVDLNLKRLLKQEDLDKDLKITVEDTGPKCFLLETLDGKTLEVKGHYYLSNLLQLLAHAHQSKQKVITLKTSELFLNPVDHLSSQIKERHWDALTRTLDEKGIIALLEDTKTNSKKKKRLYVPFNDEIAFNLFEKVAKKHPYLHLDIIRLPEKLDPDLFEKLDQKPGLLSLALDPKTLKGRPFVVPGGRFNELYGWDSYFIVLGLLQDGRIGLACSILDNFRYEIEHYGAILNANRTYFLSRSQPPLFTSMMIEVLKHLPENKSTDLFIEKAINAALLEYKTIWCHPDRETASGLTRYFGQKLKEPIEVEKGHFDAIYKKHSKKTEMAPAAFRKAYLNGEIQNAELDSYFVHDRAMRESGHDTTNRLVNHGADLNTVDLNSLLYKYEEDIANLIQKFHKGSFVDNEGCTQTTKEWKAKAQKRAGLMIELMWNEKKGLFFDYDFKKEKRTTFESATTFYPLFAGLATPEIAKLLIEKGLPLFECAGGLVSTTQVSRGEVSEDRPQRQWDYPFGWAPHQMLFWTGASNYGYNSIARRVAYRWLHMITKEAKDYNGVLAEKYDVIKCTHKAEAEYGNEGVDFGLYPNGGFGWVNASYQVGLSYLSKDEKEALKVLSPAEDLFKSK